ncbi:helix-turn-helix transcriptional regulator [Streptomyces sp. P9(2023)]|uniref:helix-turn-helix domain-containing protein n=1 Tax=Streptomyces sp. P9(2023) TaxID=3064394 RepID=UPI0028F40363|nr:helix-turn-helix transcriptional regulator [Streptomyces sp. P9(2023)]MDT9693287.1 helix-turn-helix transcriptional regulator [Streptomyces sp. P9(2023)]
MGANVILKARMGELGLTQDELARQMNVALEALGGKPGDVSARTVRNLLNGSTRRPIGRTCAALEAVFGCPVSALGFDPPRTAAQAEGPVHRRTFLVAATGTAVAAATPAGRSQLGQPDVDRFHREYTELLRDDRRGGARRTENKAVELAARIQSSLAAGGASDRVRRQMYRLASDVTCLAAFAAIDASAPQRARAHLDTALTLAGLARDSETMYRVWDHLMLTSSQRENHAEAAAGAEVMKRSSVARRDPLYASLGHMRHANASARLRQPVESLRALNLAERAFGRTRGERPPAWIAFYGRAEFDALSSYVWTALGEHERAESCLHRTLAAIPGDMVRDTALYTAHLSLCQARQGEVALACATGRQAYEMLLPASGSQRATNTLARTRQVIEATGTKAPEVVSWIEESRRWT